MTVRLIERIEAVELARPEVEVGRVEVALLAHLEQLGIDPVPVRWSEGGAGSERVGGSGSRDSLEWLRARARARAAAQAVGWRPGHLEEESVAHGDLVAAERIVAVWNEVELASRGRLGRGEPFGVGRVWLARGIEVLRANPVAPWIVDAVGWSSAPKRFAEALPVAVWTKACTALVDAYEAGLGFFWVLADEIVAVSRPRLSLVEGQLHNDSGPAVAWPNGERYWFWRGLRVPHYVIEAPEKITALDIHGEPNAERRRVMLERMGYERYASDSGGTVIAEDRYGRLWRCEPLPGENEPLLLVDVTNATPEPDGSVRRYFLRVPPTAATPHEAVAWTFGFEPTRYAPAAES